MADLVEVLAHRIANQWLLDDQQKAIEGGCDVMLRIDPYLPKARVDVAFTLAALEAAGYRVVPVEPTAEMIAAWGTTEPPEWQADDDAYCRTGWRDMLAAAPKINTTGEKTMDDVVRFTPEGFGVVEADAPKAADYEAHIADLSAKLEAAEAIVLERAGPQFAGLCQFRAADGRICLTLLADGTLEKGEAFPDDDAASAAFFDSMAKNLKGHLQDRENRMVAAEAEAAFHRRRVEEALSSIERLQAAVSGFDRERQQLQHQTAVAEAKAAALLEARGKQ